MASAAPSMDVEEEFTCPICMEYLTDPVVLDCGHSFCQGCITNYCEKWEELGDLECPICKCKIQKGNFRRNWQLASIVEKMKLLPLKSGNEDLCKKHKEKLLLFCKEDEELVCVLCKRSPEHKGHTTVPLEEAAQQHKDKILKHLETVRTEREKILAYLEDAENESRELLKITESERQKIMAEFRKLHWLLKEQENRLLFHVEEMEKEIARRRDEHMVRLSEELSSLESLIREKEEKHQQPVMELLQDVRSTLQRCEQKEHLENLVAFPLELKWKLQGCCDIGPILGGVRKQFQDTLVSVPPQMQKANVTLDPTAASKNLILSEDQRSVKCRRDTEDLPKKNYVSGYVLGCEGFRRGCHFWEVSVGSEDSWGLGVAKKHGRGSSFTPEDGFWVVGRYDGKYEAFIKDIDPPLPVTGELKRIRVCLNYDVGRVAFFDADAGTLLYAFSGVAFSGQTLCPYFQVWDKGYLRLSSSDS